MSTPLSNTPLAAARLGLRLGVACDFAAVREGAQTVRAWLGSRGCSEDELNAWELAIVEAGNNAVEYAPEACRGLPIGFEVSVGHDDVEARITDHTGGFDPPETSELPDLESEGGRGLFLIRSLTDEASYFRGRGENQFVLRRHRDTPGPPISDEAADLSRRLGESEQAVEAMGEELASSYESLVAVFRYSAELGKHMDLREFAGRLLADLVQLTETDIAVLRLAHEGRLENFMLASADRVSVPVLGDVASTQRGVEVEALATREDVWIGSGHPLEPDDPLWPAAPRSGIVHAFGAGGNPLGTVALLRCQGDAPLRSAQVNILHTLIDFLGIEIVNTRLLNERTESRITRRELEIAANIQRSLLPVSLPEVESFELAASCTSAREVGGDFYDILRVGDDGVLLVIADVMGKGVPAALFAAVLRSAIRSMPSLFTEPAALLTAINRTLCEDLSRVDMFVTAKVVFLDARRQSLLSASAGHCPLLVWTPGAAAARVADDAGLPLGILPDTRYGQSAVPFPPGAVTLLYTDGVTESADAAGTMYGMERLQAFLPALGAPQVPASEVVGVLMRELDEYRSGAALADDQTFLILRHRP